MLLWRLPGYVGGVPEQPVSREVVAVMAQTADGEVAHWRVDFWIADADAAAARAAELAARWSPVPMTQGRSAKRCSPTRRARPSR